MMLWGCLRAAHLIGIYADVDYVQEKERLIAEDAQWLSSKSHKVRTAIVKQVWTS